MRSVLVTGGAGFVGANLAICLKRDHPSWTVAALDNLHRRGSELNLSRLREKGVLFFHGDVRIMEDLEGAGTFNLLVECSAEPSALAGYNSSPAYLYQTNLSGTLNCLELCRRYGADILFLSTSRVYPMGAINSLDYRETQTRFHVKEVQDVPGVSPSGFNEEFPLKGARSLYGATKLCSELMIQEYMAAFHMRGVILRCGVLTGPWQMGKVDQGFVVLWLARHLWSSRLAYVGYGGKGKQVRDILHVRDLYKLVRILLDRIDEVSGEIFNVGGGQDLSVSLCELTEICRKITGNEFPIQTIPVTRHGDIPYYVSDCRRVRTMTGWKPRRDILNIMTDIHGWLRDNEADLRPLMEDR